MNDQTIPAEIVGAETESQDYQHRGELRREYTTRITVVINTPDLARVDLTRPITIHQENPPRKEGPAPAPTASVAVPRLLGDPMTNIDRAEQVIQGLVDHPETPEIVAQALADAGLLAPALPDGWRLADHKLYGRVIVTSASTSPNDDGYVYILLSTTESKGYDWVFCPVNRLTFLDTGKETDQ